VVETNVVLAERLRRCGGAVLVESEERVAEQIHRVVEARVGVLVQDGLGIEKLLIPGNAHGQVPDGERNVGERRKLCHQRTIRPTQARDPRRPNTPTGSTEPSPATRGAQPNASSWPTDDDHFVAFGVGDPPAIR
jgi:hypothetical protein